MARSFGSEFADLLSIKGDRCLQFTRPDAALAVCPDMGGRVFAEVLGLSMHRIDLDCVNDPTRPFNNFGGGNFWPAPEGGRFGFNYCGDEWIVQKAINNEPFEVAQAGKNSACIEKPTVLTNRAGAVIEAVMRREIVILDELPRALRERSIAGWLAYRTTDSFDVRNAVNTDEGLIAAWTLEQFDATRHTVAFCAVENPREAINFEFYEHPGDRVAYFDRGFTYQTDGLKRGQIGIKKAAGASLIGFHDAFRGVVCIRENQGDSEGIYFNIADNDQPDGPFSAADNYSIFNSDADMGAFELETVGCARIENGMLCGSKLVSVTTFAVFDPASQAEQVAMRLLG